MKQGSESEARLAQQKAILEKANKMLSHQLRDNTSKLEVLEKEISIYKQKFNTESGSINSNMISMLSSAGGKSFLTTRDQESLENFSTPVIKVSKRELRKLTDEEVMKRNSSKSHTSPMANNQNNANNIVAANKALTAIDNTKN